MCSSDLDRAEAVSCLFASLHRVADLQTVLPGMAAAPGAPLKEGLSPGARDLVPQPSPALSPGRRDAEPGAADLPPPIASTSPGDPPLRLQHLTVAHPGGGRPLLEGLDLALMEGQRLLVTGPSGSGKTSLLRVLCGLAPAAAGRLQLPAPERTLVLPQQPFLPLGSLREQILFPAAADASAPADRHQIGRAHV